jgi:AcrR family transcriptional regulator
MATPPPRRNSAPKAAPVGRAERKRQLLGHAKRLFAAVGYQATSTEQIAAAAGVTEPTLYRHFENKRAFLVGILAEIRAATIDRWNAQSATLSDPLAKVHAIADLYLDAAQVHETEFRILHRALVEVDEEEIVGLLREFYLDWEALLARIIADGQQTGVFRRSLDPRVGAWELIRTALSYTLTSPLGIPLYAEADYLPRAIDCLLHCLLKTDV